MDRSVYEEVLKSDAFIDNTEMIFDLFQRGINNPMMILMISAPYRCGKSTNLDMVRRFLEVAIDSSGNAIMNVEKISGRWKEKKKLTQYFQLFKNLRIYEQRDFFYQHCNQYPVIFLNLSQLRVDDIEKSMKETFKKEFERHSYLLKSRKLPKTNKQAFKECLQGQTGLNFVLDSLANCLHKHFKKKVVLLIDEYDASIMKLLNSGCQITEQNVKDHLNIVAEAISPLLKHEENLLGVLIFTKTQLKAILSHHANNLKHLRFLGNHVFSRYLGFTETDITGLLQRSVFKNVDKGVLKVFYNGYQTEDLSTVLYHTHAVVSYLYDFVNAGNPSDVNPRSYWFTFLQVNFMEKMFEIKEVADILRSLLKAGNEITIKSVELTATKILNLKNLLHNPSAPTDKNTIYSYFQYLWDSGFFYRRRTLADGSLVLMVPNQEILIEIEKQLSEAVYRKLRLSKAISEVHVDTYINALLMLNGKEIEFQNLANSIKNIMPENVVKHDDIKSNLRCFADQSQDILAVSEVHAGVKGKKYRLDLQLILKSKNIGIIIEVASGDKNEEGALNQILLKKYYTPLKTLQLKKKFLIGLQRVEGHIKLAAMEFDVETESGDVVKVQSNN